jgi:hypothetical protein
MCPLLTDTSMFGFIVPSPKQHDLRRDGQYAIHSAFAGPLAYDSSGVPLARHKKTHENRTLGGSGWSRPGFGPCQQHSRYGVNARISGWLGPGCSVPAGGSCHEFDGGPGMPGLSARVAAVPTADPLHSEYHSLVRVAGIARPGW